MTWRSVCVFEKEACPAHCGNKSFPCTGKTLGATRVLGEEREGDRESDGWAFQGREERKGEHPLGHTTKPFSLSLPLNPSTNTCKVFNSKCTAALHDNK